MSAAKPSNYSAGDVYESGDCGMFAAGINMTTLDSGTLGFDGKAVRTTRGRETSVWYNRIEVYGVTTQQAVDARDVVLHELWHAEQTRAGYLRGAATCDQEVYDNGELIGVFDMPKAEAEAYCTTLTAETGRKHDWHYVGGRVYVKALPAPATRSEG